MTRTMSATGMPSVMQTISGDAGVGGLEDRVGGAGGGTKMTVASAPVLLRRPRATVSKIGTPSHDGARLAGRDAGDHLRAVVAAALEVELAGLARGPG